MVGAEFAASTVMANAGSEAVACPSLTEMTMFEVCPTLADPGVPRSSPVAVLNVAHAGRLTMANVRLWPSGSVATGWKR